MKYENLIQRSDREFKRLTGVTPVLFHEMLKVTTEAESRKVKSGRPHTLSLADQLLLTLSYLRHYHTQLELAAIYGLSESNVCRTIRKTEDALIRCKRFSLPKHKNLGDQTVIIDVTESPIERPKKQRQYYSGKKKRHTVKIQVIYGRETEKIISIRTGMGAQHDMRLAKRHLAELYPYKIVIADKGYQGLAKTGLQTPKKKSKHHPLNKQDKEANRRLGKLRTVIEHINRKLKIFKILSLPYRNRRKRFGLRVNLIAGLVNAMG
ncbi:IS5 family transposase [Neisseria sp. CP9]|uniref:IS5 family transposase n=1 Tax=Neisseria sp. CP9 TaxID=3388843 RepID=UPI0039EE5042